MLKRYFGRYALMGLAIAGLIAGGIYFAQSRPADASEKDRKIQEIMRTPEFEQKARDEAERIYYKGLLEESKQRLDELDKSGFQPQAMKAAALTAYLESKGAHELRPFAAQIVQLPRWIEVVAIASHETGLCSAGVGDSRNNCGAVKNGSGEFKRYASKLDSLEDLAALLQKPRYAGKTIAEMNGTYCVDELNDDGACAGWTESIELAVEELKVLAYGG